MAQSRPVPYRAKVPFPVTPRDSAPRRSIRLEERPDKTKIIRQIARYDRLLRHYQVQTHSIFHIRLFDENLLKSSLKSLVLLHVLSGNKSNEVTKGSLNMRATNHGIETIHGINNSRLNPFTTAKNIIY